MTNPMNEWMNCPLCNGSVGRSFSSRASIANHVFIIITECDCGLSFVTSHLITDNDEEKDIAWKKHTKRWNTRQYQKDMIDIGVYATNIFNRTQEYSQLKKETNDD